MRKAPLTTTKRLRKSPFVTIATDYRDGGFFVEAGTKVLRGWWYFDDDGNKTNGILGTPLPEYKAIP